MVSHPVLFKKHSVIPSDFLSQHYQESFPTTAWRAISKGSCTPFIKNSVMSLQMRRHDSNGDKQTYHPAQKNPIGQPMKSNNKIHKIVQRTLIAALEIFWF